MNEQFVTEFVFSPKGASATIASYKGATSAANETADAAKRANAALGAAIPSGRSGGYSGAIPPRVGAARLGPGYGGNVPPVIGGALDDLGKATASGLGGLFEGAKGIVSGLAGIVPVVGPVLQGIVGAFATAATAVVAVLAGAGIAGVKAANEKDTLERMLGDAFGGDLGKGKSTYGELTRYAKTSSFQTNVNAEQAIKFTGAEMSWQRYLPVASKFAGRDDQKLNQVVSALTRIKSGALGEGLESLREGASIGRNQLEREGIKYSKGNTVESSAEEVLAAIERIAARRGNLAGSGNEARLGNVFDQVQMATASFGDAIARTAIPFLEKFGNALEELTESGALEAVGNAFAGLLDAIGGDGSGLGGVFFELSVGAATFLDHVTLATGAFKGLIEGVENVVGFLATIGLGPAGRAAANTDLGRKVVEGIKKGAVGGAGYVSVAGDLPDRRALMENELRMRKEAREREAASKKAGDGIPDPNKDDPKDDRPEMKSYLARIADNTGKQLDLSERLLGGGSVSKAAFSEVAVGNALGADPYGRIAEVVRDVVGEVIAQQMRSRMRTA